MPARQRHAQPTPANTKPAKPKRRQMARAPAPSPSQPPPQAPLPKLLYTRRETAAILVMSVRHLDTLISRGDILSFKPGKQRVVPMHAIEAYIASHVG